MNKSFSPLDVFGNTQPNTWEQVTPLSISMATSDATWMITHREGCRHEIKRFSKNKSPFYEMACAPTTEMAKELVERIISRDDGGGFDTLVEHYGWEFSTNPYGKLESIYIPIKSPGVKSNKGYLIGHIKNGANITFEYQGKNGMCSWPILSGYAYDETRPPEEGGELYWEDGIDIKAIVLKMAYERVVDYCTNTKFTRNYKSV